MGEASHRVASLLGYPFQEPDGQIDIISKVSSEVTASHHVVQVELTIPNLKAIAQRAWNSRDTTQKVGVLLRIPETNPQLAGVGVFLQSFDDFHGLVIVPDELVVGIGQLAIVHIFGPYFLTQLPGLARVDELRITFTIRISHPGVSDSLQELSIGPGLDYPGNVLTLGIQQTVAVVLELSSLIVGIALDILVLHSSWFYHNAHLGQVPLDLLDHLLSVGVDSHLSYLLKFTILISYSLGNFPSLIGLI